MLASMWDMKIVLVNLGDLLGFDGVGSYLSSSSRSSLGVANFQGEKFVAVIILGNRNR